MKQKGLAKIAGIIFTLEMVFVGLQLFKDFSPLTRAYLSISCITYFLLAFTLLKGEKSNLFYIAVLGYVIYPFLANIMCRLFPTSDLYGGSIIYSLIRFLMVAAILFCDYLPVLQNSSNTIKKLWFLPLLFGIAWQLLSPGEFNWSILLSLIVEVTYALTLKIAISDEE